MTAIIIVAIILIIIGIANYLDTDTVGKRKREEFEKMIEKTNESFSKSKSFKNKKLQEEMLVKEETPVEAKGVAVLTEHIESVVKTHPETVKKLTKADKTALGKVGTRRTRPMKP
jgi:flagellar biosynthesis/type III secretory pathway M-ring protein FliF/YscJ